MVKYRHWNKIAKRSYIKVNIKVSFTHKELEDGAKQHTRSMFKL